ncbi:hypothetical protein [Novosphingobium sp. ZW T3_23]
MTGPFTGVVPGPEIRKLDLFTIAGLTVLLWAAIIGMTMIVL